LKAYVIILLVSGFIIGVNWFDISALYPSMNLSLNFGPSGLGQISGAFLIGNGIMQVPAGIYAVKKSARASMIYGLLISFVSTLLMTESTNLSVLVVLRLATGVGLALSFVPGISLITSHFNEQSRGSAIGLYNVTWLIGGMFALYGETILAPIIGWRLILSLNGASCLGVIFALILLPGKLGKEETKESTTDYHFSLKEVARIISNPLLLLIGSTLLADGISNNTVTSFIVFYLENHFGASPSLAGAVAVLSPLLGIVSSLFFGKLFDRAKHLWLMMLFIGIAAGSALAVLSIDSVYAAIIGTIIEGFFGSAGFVFGIASVRYALGSENQRALTVGAGWVFTILLAGSFIGPVFFSSVVVAEGYSLGWIFTAGLSLIFLAPFVIFSGSAKSLFKQRKVQNV
jgi:MFS family permease